MNRRTLLWTLPLAALLAGGGYWLGRLSMDGSTQAQRLSDLEKENAGLRSSLQRLQQSAPGQAADSGDSRFDRDARGQRLPAKPEQGPFNDKQIITSLQESLLTHQKAAAEKDSRIAALEGDVASLREQTKRLADSQSELNEQIIAARQQVDHAQAELKGKQDQIAQNQTENKKLRDQITDAGQKLSRLQKTMAELQDIYRRRETYLTSLLNRYRDVNQQYRSFAAVLENRSTSEATTGGPRGPELARIQNAISLAEEDLRQLNNLNAQAQRVQKQLEHP